MVMEIWPSCERWRSTMFISAMIFSRLITAGAIEDGRAMTSWRAPSMRYRIRSRSSCGSMWMSEARSRRPCVMMRLTTFTTGASAVTVCWMTGSTWRELSASLKASTSDSIPVRAR